MIVVTIARKPVPTTVARNALHYGTGALNIDAARIKPSGTVLHDRGSDPANRRGEVGKDFGFARVSKEKMQQAQRESIERTNTLGRWPAIFILEHRAGCLNHGLRQVQGRNKASDSMNGPSKAENTSGGYGHSTPSPIIGYADSDGLETVSDWECPEDCPVADLERQSLEGGIHGAGGASDGKHCPSTGAFGPVPISAAGMPSYRYGDKGGAFSLLHHHWRSVMINPNPIHHLKVVITDNFGEQVIVDEDVTDVAYSEKADIASLYRPGQIRAVDLCHTGRFGLALNYTISRIAKDYQDRAAGLSAVARAIVDVEKP